MIITKSRKILVAILMASSLTLPLYSQSLNDLLTKAQKESNTTIALKLSKEQSLLTIRMNDLSRNKTYSINPTITANLPTYSTDSTASTTRSLYSFGGKGNLIAFNFPGNKHLAKAKSIYDDTNLFIDFGTSVDFDHVSGDLNYSLTPSVSMDHTFLYGDYDTLKEDVTEQINFILVEQSYQKGMIDYKSAVLNMVKNIIINDQNQEKLKNSIEEAQVSIKNKLDLELYNETTVGYKSDMITLNSLNNTLENAINQRVVLESRFKDYTGFSYVGVDAIEKPVLEINPIQGDSLTVQMAKLKLQLAQNTVDEIIKDKDRSSLKITGSEKPTYNNFSRSSTGVITKDGNLINSASVNLAYTADSFSITGDASLKTTINNNVWTNTPSFTLSGNWTNDSTEEYDVIESKKNANELIATQSTLSSTLSEDSYKRINLKADIDSWNFTYSQLKDNMKIAEDNNKLINQMFDLGLKTQAELDKSNLDLAQMKYDELNSLIDGWIVELNIEALNL